jgi:uncharacterized membrane protein
VAEEGQVKQWLTGRLTQGRAPPVHLTFLLGITLMPFSTALLAAFITIRLALVVYWLNLLFLGVVLLASWRYARRAGLITKETTPEMLAAVERRIVVAQTLYALAMVLCVTDTYVTIAVLVLLQLVSAVAPRVFPLDRF